MGYKIDKPTNKNTINLWNAELEAMIALFANKLEEIRGKDAAKTVKFLNHTFLRKRTGKLDTNYGATKFQRTILKKGGY